MLPGTMTRVLSVLLLLIWSASVEAQPLGSELAESWRAGGQYFSWTSTVPDNAKLKPAKGVWSDANTSLCCPGNIKTVCVYKSGGGVCGTVGGLNEGLIAGCLSACLTAYLRAENVSETICMLPCAVISPSNRES